MTTPLTLAQLTERTGFEVLEHLEGEVAIPVIDGLQAQGDLIVVPLRLVPQVRLTGWADRADWAGWRAVPRQGIELLRSAAGGNPHTLMADPGTCRWTTGVYDPVHLALGVLTTTATAYLIHPEHGATGIAPGTYLVRRQRERLDGSSGSAGRLLGFRGGDRFVAD